MSAVEYQTAYDRQDQYDQIMTGLMPSETAVVVYDGKGAGTGFLAVTTHRVILQDKSFVGKKVAITSIPFNRIASVSMLSNKSWGGSFFSTSSLALLVQDRTYEVEFRGEDKAKHVHNLILHYMREQQS